MGLRWLGQGAATVAVVCALGLTSPPPAAAAPAAPAPSTWQAAACGRTFTDQLSATPWPLQRLRPEAAWPLSRGQGVTVAVIDSGVSRTHVKLAGQVLDGNDFVDPGGPGDCDNDGHGTLVAGLIAGRDTPESPFHGVAPDARILPVKVLPDSRPVNNPDMSQRIADAIVWSVEHGASIINLSLTTPDTPDLVNAVKYAASEDVLLVAAAGNNGGSARAGEKVYPAAYDEVIAVAGIDRDGARVSTSNAGDYVDLAAPGLAIEGPSTQGDGYVVDPAGGTSFAAAYISGVAALVRAHDPDLPAPEVARRMTTTADAPPEGHNWEVGAGVVNPYRAVAAILDSRDTNVPAIAGEVPTLAAPDRWNAMVATIAIVAALVGVLVAVVLLVVVPLVRGRLRGPDPDKVGVVPAGRRAAPPSPAPSLAEPELGPVMISSPSVRRIHVPSQSGTGTIYGRRLDG